MSASFYDLMKYAKTGIASQSMTKYDKQKALAMCGGGFPISTITGIPPISFKSDGTPLTAWSISGDMTQDGTPTPDSPIWHEECGDRTANLYVFPYTSALAMTGSGQNRTVQTSNYVKSSIIKLQPSTEYTFSGKRAKAGDRYGRIGLFEAKPEVGSVTTRFITFSGDNSVTFTTSSSECYALVQCDNSSELTVDYEMMLNTGSTALPYEPYGHKIPITLAGQTQNIYLDEPMRKIGDYADTISSAGTVTRRIKERILTGTESWQTTGDGASKYNRLKVGAFNTAVPSLAVCTHALRVSITTSTTDFGCNVIDSQTSNASFVAFRLEDYQTLSSFKQFLADQYVAGTPVCVWYVLQEPTTEQITAPTLTPEKGSNMLSVGTTLLPSTVSITGHIKN